MEKVTEKGIKFTTLKFKTIPWDRKANIELRSCKERSDKIDEPERRHFREKCWGLGVPANEQSCWLANCWFKGRNWSVFYR